MRKIGGRRMRLFAAVLLCMITACAVSLFASASDGDSTVLSGEGDVIKAGELTYGRNEPFSYSARVSFRSGNAAGLAFGITDTQAFVLLADRGANRVKFIKFVRDNADSEWSAADGRIYEEPFIGNEKTTRQEYDRIEPCVAAREQFDIRIEYGGENKVRLYIDDIERLRDWGNASYDGMEIADYAGGALGLQVYSSEAQFNDVFAGSSDTEYYNEPYRPQYHFTQGAYWNNDPNGMVYHNGYYHLFYQHNPFGKTWGDMYWGHARSKDLLHWEHLPICLFPDERGFMWSGSAMSCDNLQAVIGGGAPSDSGLIGYLTREAGRQEQLMIYSSDGGVTWTKYGVVIPTEANKFYNAANPGIAFRDPKVFSVTENVWGIIIGGGRYQFFTSEDLVHWNYSSCLPVDAECPDIVKIGTDDGDKWVITMSSRNYLVGELRYDGGRIKFYDEKGEKELTADNATLADCNIRTMDFGPDAYASQSFYINDETSEYNGKAIAISWFNNPLPEVGDNANAMAALRDPWNGGFTFPAELGLEKVGEEYRLTQTPISGLKDLYGDTLFKLTESRTVTASDGNILSGVKGAQLDITASVTAAEGTCFGFRVQEGVDGYTEVGYGSDGYYVDRTHASSGGIGISKYARRYDSGVFAENGTATFRILTDANSVEVFAENGTVAFFAVTFPSKGSVGVSMFTDGDVTVNSLSVSEVRSAWRDSVGESETCTKLELSMNEVYMDGAFVTELAVAAFANGPDVPVWSVSPQDVASVVTDESGYAAKLTALRAGNAVVTVTCGDKTEEIAVHVGGSSFSGNVTAGASNVVAGSWNINESNNLRGDSAGDGDLIFNESADDFTFSVNMAISGQAAAVTFRAAKDLSSYYKANYDSAQNVIKLWTRDSITGSVRELANVPYAITDKDNIVFAVRAIGNNIRITVNGREKININDYNENAPKSGLLGLNTFNGQTVFSQIVYESTFKAASSAITSDTPFVVTVGSKKPENISLNGTALKDGEYRIASGQLYINAGVAETGKNVLTFTADGETYTFEFTVTEASAAAPPKEERGGLAGWAIALIVIACVVAAGGGGFCLYWFVLRGKFKPDGKNTDGGAEKTAEDGENGGEH